MRIRLTGALTSKDQAFRHAARLERALEEPCFVFEVPAFPLSAGQVGGASPACQEGYREAYELGYRYLVCSRREKIGHLGRGIVFLNPPTNLPPAKKVSPCVLHRKPTPQKKKPLISTRPAKGGISRNQRP